MPVFFVDYESTRTTTINAPLHTVVDFLHDAEALIRLNPAVIDVKQDAEDPTKYTVTDLLSVLGVKTRVTYVAQMTRTESGVEGLSRAGGGTTTLAVFSAREVGSGVTELEERSRVNCFFLFLPFIKGVIARTHTESHERIKKRLEGQADADAAKQL